MRRPSAGSPSTLRDLGPVGHIKDGVRQGDPFDVRRKVLVDDELQRHLRFVARFQWLLVEAETLGLVKILRRPGRRLGRRGAATDRLPGR